MRWEEEPECSPTETPGKTQKRLKRRHAAQNITIVCLIVETNER